MKPESVWIFDTERDKRPLLSVQDLVVEYAARQDTVRAVDRASLDVYAGDWMAVVGESGCGKSTLAYAIIRQVPHPGEIKEGTILFDGQNVLELDRRALREFRWKEIAIVFQAAQNALNPVMRIADQMIETVVDHESRPRKEILVHASELLRLVRLEPARVLRAYPHELSGGMKQRVIIAMSLLLNPRLLILDEPTTALDVVTQNYILDILADIRKKLRLTMLLLTHDMSIVAKVSDRVGVMYAGQIVETGRAEEIFYHPWHPYTRGLLKAAPSLIGELGEKRPIPGFPPDMRNPPPGCRFHPRCSYADDRCSLEEPSLEKVDGRQVACHYWQRIRAEVDHD